jgi:hypothetical protein
MDTKSKESLLSTFKVVGLHYIKLFKRGLAFVFCVITFPIFLIAKGSVLLYAAVIK